MAFICVIISGAFFLRHLLGKKEAFIIISYQIYMFISLLAQRKGTPITCPAMPDSLRFLNPPGAAKLVRLRRTQTVLALFLADFAMLGCVIWIYWCLQISLIFK
jgi:hypothetical protein